MAKQVLDLLKTLNIQYKDENVYKQAFTHCSYTNEHDAPWGDYQRLEFMGDAVLELAISKYIFTEYDYMDEGSLSLLRSNLVRMETLSVLATKLKLGEYILLGTGEEKTNGKERPNLLCDVYEALIAAIYLDLGYDEAEKFIFSHYRELIEEQGMQSFLQLKDPKTRLQELVQADSKRALNYLVVSSEGPANHPTFEVAVMLDKTTLGVGKGGSKKIAEQEAAKDALNKMAK